jgi:hypothetical protein
MSVTHMLQRFRNHPLYQYIVCGQNIVLFGSLVLTLKENEELWIFASTLSRREGRPSVSATLGYQVQK